MRESWRRNTTDQPTRSCLESSVVLAERRLLPPRPSGGKCNIVTTWPQSTNYLRSESSHEDMYGVKCNLKAVQGTLFPLEKSLFFVAKQPHLVEFADIHQVVFSRYVLLTARTRCHLILLASSMGSGTAAARTFDLRIVSKSGPEVTFTSINKEEHDPIENYLTSKKVRTKNEMADLDLIGAVAAVDSDDDEMQSVASDGSERPKPRAVDEDDESELGAYNLWNTLLNNCLM